MANGLIAPRRRASSASPSASPSVARARRRRSTPRAALDGRPRHVRARRHRLGRRGAHRHRRARQPLARRADRHGGEPALRRPRDDGDQDLRPPLGLAELDLPAPERRRRARRAHALRQARAPRVRLAAGPERRQPMSTVINDAKIPNNVDLASDKRLQRALEAWQPNFLDWWKRDGARGLPGGRHLPAHRDQRRPRGLGALRLREDARLPLGHLPRRPGAGPHDRLRRRHAASRCGSEVPGEYRNTLRRLIVTQGDTEPASVEQQRLLGQTVPERLRPAQPLPGERRRGPPPLGDGLPAPHATSAATAARRPRSCSSAAAATPTSRASSARSTSRAPTGSRSSCSRSSPTATASTSSSPSPRAASIRSRARRASC